MDEQLQYTPEQSYSGLSGMQTFWALIFSFGLTVVAQTTTTSVFLPIIDSQPLVASLAHENDNTKTLIVKCPDGTDPNKCGFPTPVTVTAGPSLVSLTTTIGNTVTVDLKCDIEGSSKATCHQMYTGPQSLLSTSITGSDGSKTTTWSASQVVDTGSVTYFPVTITAGVSSSSNTAKKNAGAGPTGAFGPVVAAGLVANMVGYL